MVGMHMSMSPALIQSHRLEQRQRLSMQQRLEIKAQQTLLMIELVAALREERYQPKGDCPKCRRILSPNEILAGFRDDVEDFTTRCTGCSYRFEPLLICFTKRRKDGNPVLL